MSPAEVVTQSTGISVQLLILIVGPLIALLLAGNLYFIRELVSSIKDTATDTQGLKIAVAALDSKLDTDSRLVTGKVEGVSNQLREIRQEVKDLKKIELDVAVLKAVLDQRPNGPRAQRGKMKLQNQSKA